MVTHAQLILGEIDEMSVEGVQKWADDAIRSTEIFLADKGVLNGEASMLFEMLKALRILAEASKS